MAAKKILILNGHPDKESYNYALAEAYFKGAKASGADVQIIHIRDLHFNLNLQYGYRKRTDLEPDLLMTQEKLKWAEHLVLVYPVWWGSVPAIMKGFLDRTLLPGFAFQKRENSVWWDTLFDTKSARIICTLDQPGWFYRLRYAAPTHHAMKGLTLKFIGVKNVNITTIGPIRLSKEKFRTKYLKKIETLGMKNL